MPYRARTSFVLPVNGVKRAVTEGTIVPDGDPIVKLVPDLLEESDTYLERVERATANPGELRNVAISKPKGKVKKARA